MFIRSASDRMIVCLTCFGLLWPLWAGDTDRSANQPHPRSKLFPKAWKLFVSLDSDRNGRLNQAEFINSGEQPLVRQRQRDFQLLDLDQDQQLNFDEFRNDLQRVDRSERGSYPSRISLHVDRLLTKFDQLLPQWDLDHDGELDRTEQVESRFYATFDTELPQRERDLNPDGKPPQLVRVVPHNIDWNSDGVIQRDEFRRALEVSFGLRRVQGEPIRTESGIVYNLALFRYCDELRPDDLLTRDEFVNRSGFGDQAEAYFKAADRNQDRIITFEEWCTLPVCEADPISDFMAADTNLDGHLSPDELLKFTPDYMQVVAKHIFPGFDVDHDGKLSLTEYQSTPLCDHVYRWYELRTDQSLNQQLSRYEFQWEQNQYRYPPPTGLLLDYFSRYDVDADGALSHQEYEFITPRPPESRIFRTTVAEGDVELVVDMGMAEATYLSGLDLSPDGTSLVFDATPPRGIYSDLTKSRMIRLELEGPDRGRTFDLGFGTQPDWSPDGERLAFFINSGNPDKLKPGIWICNRDGTGRRMITSALRHPRWSPDGKKLLCSNTSSSPRRLFLLDVEKGQREAILNEVVVLGIPDWEPKGQRIAASLLIDSHRSLCLIDPKSDPLFVTELWKTKLEPGQTGGLDTSRPNWSADGREILFTDTTVPDIQPPSHVKTITRLMRVKTTQPSQPEPLASSLTPSLSDKELNGIWSFNQKQIYFTSTQPLDKIPRLINPKKPIAKPPQQPK